MTTASRVLRIVVFAGIALLLLGAARHVDWRSAWSTVRSADPLLCGAAVLASLASLLLKALRWWLFLSAVGARSMRRAVRATFGGAALNNIVAMQGGDAARVLFVARGERLPTSAVLAALTLDRLCDGVAYCALLVGAASVLSLPAALARWRGAAGVALAAVLISAIVLIARGERAAHGTSELPQTIGVRLRRYAARYLDSVSRASGSPWRVPAAMALTAAAWALQIATYHLVALATHLALPLAGSVAALLVGGVGFLVRATPGSVGIFQALYALNARSFGIAAAPAIAAAVLLQLAQMVPSTIIGLACTAGFGSRDEPGSVAS